MKFYLTEQYGEGSIKLLLFKLISMSRVLSIIAFTFLFSTGKQLYAQVDLQNTGILYSSNSADILYVNGNFTNTSAAALTNSGGLYVKGDLTNSQSSMAVGTGTLYLNGSSAQSLNGTQPFRTYHLNTNNNSGITLNNNLSVTGIHTFTNGLITTSATPNYLIYEAGSSHTGGNDSRHVNGWLKKLGNTDFTFPLGDVTYQRTIAISNLSATSEFNCRYYITTQNVYNLLSPVVQVKANEYWQLDKVSGGTAQVTLNWDHSKVPMDNILLIDILAAPYSGGNWINGGGAGTATGVVTATGSVTSNARSSFAQITLGYETFPVPLKLISFTAERKQGTSTLHWITENEQNVSHFDMQRSYDAVNYSTIGNVAARNRSQQENYFFDDRSPLKGFAWFRIRSIDIDGKFSYTRIAVVSENDLQSNSFVVLNPVRDAVTVFNKTGRDGLFDYSLYNSGGQLIMKGNVGMTSNGGAALTLPSQIAAGIYILELRNDKTQFRQKVLVER